MFKKLLSVFLLMPFLSFCSESALSKGIIDTHAEHISKTGAALLNFFWEDRATGNVDRASRHMDSHFQSVYFFGTLDKSGELNVIQNLNMISHSLSNRVETRQGSLMIITYLATVNETLDGQPIDQVSPCTTTWKKEGDHWKLMSHAELSQVAFD